MSKGSVISIVLNAHLPFIRCTGGPLAPPDNAAENSEERWFFEALSETYLPLLQVFDRLDRDRVPFRLAIVLSPTLCHMMRDEALIGRYLEYVDRRIEFGRQEIERTGGSPEMNRLARLFYDQAVDNRVLFTERCGGKLLKVFDYYQKKGRLELLTTAATYAFLPLYAAYPEALQAQLEVAIASHRSLFGINSQGFWLPEMGWAAEIDEYLRAYNFSYTLVDTHSLLLGSPPAARACFYPVKTPGGIFVLARDFYAQEDMGAREGRYCPDYRDYHEDAGYELPASLVRPFLGTGGVRTPTGYKYWAAGLPGAKKQRYDPPAALAAAREHARSFLEARISRLAQAEQLMEETPISLCAFNADALGRFWYEGPHFLESLFRLGAHRGEVRFMTPAEYLYKQDLLSLQTVAPEFSSWGPSGYAEMWLDSSNDWLYPHGVRSLERMIELAERFPNDSGLKERALNQAAREILLVQASDWPRMLYLGESSQYARAQIEMALRNFTTIYESLGSNYISTEWLTSLEKRHNIFPAINYRVFRRKR
jgi:1,4-alpha-glucan branching enzyme